MGAAQYVWGRSRTDVFARGSNGIFHFNGTDWAFFNSLWCDVWGPSDGSLFGTNTDWTAGLAAIEAVVGDDVSAEDPDNVGKHGKERHHDKAGQESRDDEISDGIGAEGVQGIHLLGHVHGAQLCRDGRPDAAGHDDGGQDRPQLL